MRRLLTLAIALVLAMTVSSIAEGQSRAATHIGSTDSATTQRTRADADMIGMSGTTTADVATAATGQRVDAAGATADKEASPAPSIYYVAPKDNVGYIAPAAPIFYVTASTANTAQGATIDHVDFLDGETVIGTVRTPNSDPSGHGYAFVWSNPGLGTHLIYARATDTLGNSAMTVDSTSGLPNPVRVSIVAAHASPQVSLIAPLTGDLFAPPNAVTFAANAKQPFRRHPARGIRRG